MNFSENIIEWYNQNKRDLPWRNTRDPYLIWISEIILQQTRVDQGLPYYYKITEAFPTVKALATAKEDAVLKHWQGLGYYSRARNMHAASKAILKDHKGEFPSDYSSILNLKGIGPYTAAAIASFAFGKSHAVVDGNVARVLSRFFGLEQPIDTSVGQKELLLTATELIKGYDPAIFNQAIMEFGAKQCVPKNPSCEKCPLKNNCVALNKNLINILPVKSKKTKQKKRFFNYVVITHKNFTYLNKRTGKDIWQNLYEFPMIETQKLMSPDKVVAEFKNNYPGSELIIKNTSKTYKHILSHQLLFARFIEVEMKSHLGLTGLLKVKKDNINKYAVPRLVENYINKLEVV